MNINQLKTKLDLLGIKPSQYSLNGDLIPDRLILFQNYYIWEVFYLDERGRREYEKKFSSEDEACDERRQLSVAVCKGADA